MGVLPPPPDFGHSFAEVMSSIFHNSPAPGSRLIVALLKSAVLVIPRKITCPPSRRVVSSTLELVALAVLLLSVKSPSV